MTRPVIRGRLSSTHYNLIYAAQRRPAMAYGGINVHKKQRQVCLLTAASEILPQRIPTQREQCAVACAKRSTARISE